MIACKHLYRRNGACELCGGDNLRGSPVPGESPLPESLGISVVLDFTQNKLTRNIRSDSLPACEVTEPANDCVACARRGPAALQAGERCTALDLIALPSFRETHLGDGCPLVVYATPAGKRGLTSP